jgi:4-hydroxy-tetrahydrodipicolinate synthase
MQGVIAAVPTPVTAHGDAQKGLFLSHCRWLLDNGCDGLNILGSTGEANSFDTASRISIMRMAAENLELPRLMVGTGTPSVTETIGLTIAAHDLGYGVALVLPPYYYKPVSDDGLFDWYEQIHNALGDRPIALYFYNFPQMTGLGIPISVIERLHTAWPDRFTGIKDSSGDLEYCRQLAKTLPKLAVFPSSEVSLAQAPQSGFAGCISATTNQTGALCARIWKTRKNPDQDLVARISLIREVIAGQTLIPSIKYLTARRTNHPDWERVLPPFRGLSQDRKTELNPVAEQLLAT